MDEKKLADEIKELRALVQQALEVASQHGLEHRPTGRDPMKRDRIWTFFMGGT